jgi:hypothetical protein
VTHEPFSRCEGGSSSRFGAPEEDAEVCANQLRWRPLPLPSAPTHFLEGLQTICGSGRCGPWLLHAQGKEESCLPGAIMSTVDGTDGCS